MDKAKSAIDIYKLASSLQKDSKPETENLLRVTQEEINNKAAKFLMLSGKDEAAKIIAKLNPEEIEEITRQIVKIRQIDPKEAQALLNEANQYFGNSEVKKVKGGIDAARRILSEAFGDAKAKKLLEKSLPDDQRKPFYFLNDLTTTQLIGLLQKENPRTLSLVLSYIEPLMASRFLKSLPDREGIDVILRMARTEKVAREVVLTVEETLREKLRVIGTDDGEAIDGKAVLADILRCMSYDDEKHLLESISHTDSQLAEQIRNKLYTMDLIIDMRNKDLQHLVREFTEEDIAKLLKGQTQKIKDTIMSALSVRRRLLVDDETDILGPIPKKEVDEISQRFLEKMRQGEEDGRYMINRENAESLD